MKRKSLKNAQTVNLNSNWLSNLIAQTAGFLAFLLATPFLIRLLGSPQFGALILFTMLPQIASQLDLGITSAGIRAIGQFNAQQKFSDAVQIFWEVLFLVFCFGLLLGSVVYFSSKTLLHYLQLENVITAHLNEVFLMLAGWCLLSLINAGVNMPIRALERFRFIALMQALSASLLWLGAILLAYLGYGLIGILYWANAVCLLIILITFVNIKLGYPLNTKLNLTKTHFLLSKAFFKFGLGIFISQAASLFTYNADKFIVSALISPSAAGIYSACANIANKSLLLVAAIAAFAFPRTVKLHAQGAKSELSSVYQQSSRASILAAMIFTAPVIGLAGPFLGLWLGAQFAGDYSLVLGLLGLSYFFAAFSVVASNISIGLGDSRIPALFAFIGGFVTIFLCYFLTKRLGIQGAALGICIGAFQAVIFNWLIAKKISTNQAKIAIKLFVFSIFTLTFFVAIALYLTKLITTWITLLAAASLVSLSVLVIWFCSGFANKTEVDYLLYLRKKLLWQQ